MWFAVLCDFLFALGGSVLCMLLGRKIGVLDVPDGNRKRHTEKTPRIGGVGIALGVAVGSALLGYWQKREAVFFLLPALFFLLLGLVDDLMPMSPFLKLAGQGAGVFLFLSLLLPEKPLIFLIFLFCLGLLFINAFNFTDGADGIAAGYAIPVALGLSAVFLIQGKATPLVLSLLTATALFGFLPLNFPTAKLFMGDCGSLGVGFMLSALTLYAMCEDIFAGLFFLLPAVDAVRTVLVRVWEKRFPWEGDRRHLHHLLLAKNVSKTALFFLYSASSIAISMATFALCLFTQ